MKANGLTELCCHMLSVPGDHALRLVKSHKSVCAKGKKQCKQFMLGQLDATHVAARRHNQAELFKRIVRRLAPLHKPDKVLIRSAQ